MRILDITIYGLLSAILIVAQVCLSFIPNVELVTILIIVYTIFLGKKALLPITTFIVVEILIYGLGLWTINYLYIWYILWAYVHFLKIKSYLDVIITSTLFGILFGFLCAIPYVLWAGVEGAITYWIMGIPFDLLHMGGNLATAATLFKPLDSLFKRLKAYYQF